MTRQPAPLTLYGAAASGSVAVEATLTLLGPPYQLIDGATWAEAATRDRVAPNSAREAVVEAVNERVAFCWATS